MILRLIPLFAADDCAIEVTRSGFQIGRSHECDLCVNSRCVSRHHCEFTLVGNDVYVRDLGSTNGTFVNRQRIHDEFRLRDGDTLALAETIYRVAVSAARSNGVEPSARDDTPATGKDAIGRSQDVALDARQHTPADEIHEAGLESFPASDPPAWTSSHV